MEEDGDGSFVESDRNSLRRLHDHASETLTTGASVANRVPGFQRSLRLSNPRVSTLPSSYIRRGLASSIFRDPYTPADEFSVRS